MKTTLLQHKGDTQGAQGSLPAAKWGRILRTDVAAPLLEHGCESGEGQGAAISKQGSSAAQRKDGKASQTQAKETLPGDPIGGYPKAELAIADCLLSRSVLTSTEVQKEMPNCFIHMLPVTPVSLPHPRQDLSGDATLGLCLESHKLQFRVLETQSTTDHTRE